MLSGGAQCAFIATATRDVFKLIEIIESINFYFIIISYILEITNPS